MIKEATRVEECWNGLPPPAQGEGGGEGNGVKTVENLKIYLS